MEMITQKKMKKYCCVKNNHSYDPVFSANYLLMVLGVVLLIGVANNNGVICQGKINLQSIMFQFFFLLSSPLHFAMNQMSKCAEVFKCLKIQMKLNSLYFLKAETNLYVLIK